MIRLGLSGSLSPVLGLGVGNRINAGAGGGTPEPSYGAGFPALLAYGPADGNYSGPNADMHTYAFAEDTGIGTEVGTSYDFVSNSYEGAIGYYGSGASFSTGYMYYPCKVPGDTPVSASLLAFAVSSGGATKVTGEVAISLAETVNSVLTAADGTTAYVVAVGNNGKLGIKAGEVSGGTFSQLGNSYSGDTTYSSAIDSGAASFVDGRLIIACSESGRTTQGYTLRAYSFDGADFTAQQTLELAGRYVSWRVSGSYLLGVRAPDVSTRRIYDAYSYTAAGGFALNFSLDTSDIDVTATYTEPSSEIVDSVTGNVWLAIADSGYTSYIVAVFKPNAGGTAMDITTITGLPEHVVFATNIYGNYLLATDENYEGTYVYKLTGSTVSSALSGSLLAGDNAFFIPIEP